MKSKARVVFFHVNVNCRKEGAMLRSARYAAPAWSRIQHVNLTLCVHGITALNEGANKQCFIPVQKQDRSNAGLRIC